MFINGLPFVILTFYLVCLCFEFFVSPVWFTSAEFVSLIWFTSVLNLCVLNGLLLFELVSSEWFAFV